MNVAYGLPYKIDGINLVEYFFSISLKNICYEPLNSISLSDLIAIFDIQFGF